MPKPETPAQLPSKELPVRVVTAKHETEAAKLHKSIDDFWARYGKYNDGVKTVGNSGNLGDLVHNFTSIFMAIKAGKDWNYAHQMYEDSRKLWEQKVKDGRIDRLKKLLPDSAEKGVLEGRLGSISGGLVALSGSLKTDEKYMPKNHVKAFIDD